MIIPLLKGLKLTLSRFLSKPVTIQYPEQKMDPAPRWRGIQYFVRDENGETTCVGCGLCMAVCPSQCIYVETAEDENGRRYPTVYELNAIRCIFCGYCEEACPVNAIKMGKNYELIGYGRDEFILTTERLLEEESLNR
jgi:NADH-quinone oxidoreductase chain I